MTDNTWFANIVVELHEFASEVSQYSDEHRLLVNAATEITGLRTALHQILFKAPTIEKAKEIARTAIEGIEHGAPVFDMQKANAKFGMTDKEGTLRMMASRRWAVCRTGREPVVVKSGERFRVEFQGELKLTSMEYDHSGRRYYSVDGYPLRDGLRAAIGGHE